METSAVIRGKSLGVVGTSAVIRGKSLGVVGTSAVIRGKSLGVVGTSVPILFIFVVLNFHLKINMKFILKLMIYFPYSLNSLKTVFSV